MYQLHYFPANANAAPHMVLEEQSKDLLHGEIKSFGCSGDIL